MTNVEKIIKGLEQCWEKKPDSRNCNECPYQKYFGEKRGKSCADRMNIDALKMLKWQKQRINELEEKLRVLECGEQNTLKDIMMPAT